jgi:hypothetical protein
MKLQYPFEDITAVVDYKRMKLRNRLLVFRRMSQKLRSRFNITSPDDFLGV